MDPRPIIGRPSYGPRRPIKEPCKYFARGGCDRGDKCWFSHDPQVWLNPSDTISLYVCTAQHICQLTPFPGHACPLDDGTL